jgi:hypothetical protein
MKTKYKQAPSEGPRIPFKTGEVMSFKAAVNAAHKRVMARREPIKRKPKVKALPNFDGIDDPVTWKKTRR